MTEDGTDALEQALALHATPGRISRLRDRPLPGAVLTLIRIAAGDREAVKLAAQRSSESPQVVLDAALLYLQQVLFDAQADSYRLLGVRSDASDASIKEHYRWLMRWLHPDRHPDRWEVVYSDRVNRAWKSLSTEQRRREYDEERAQQVEPFDIASVAPARVVSVRIPRSETPHVVLSPRAIRKLPMIVLGTLAIAAVVVVALLYVVDKDEQASVDAASRKVASAAVDDSSAQEEAVRRSMAFDERVIELSQPVAPEDVPQSPPAEKPVTDAPPAPPPEAMLPPAPPVAPLPRVQAAAVIPPPEPRTVPAQIPVPRVVARPVAPAPVAVASDAPPPRPTRPERLAARRAASLAAADDARASRSAQADAAATPAPATDPPPNARGAEQDAPATVTRAFENAYARGDLPQMMRLFAPNAVNGRGGINAIAEDYAQLFESTSARDLHLDGLEWIVQPDRIVGSGAFRAKIRRRDELLAKSVHGWLQIEAIPINGRWKIQRILNRNSE